MSFFLLLKTVRDWASLLNRMIAVEMDVVYLSTPETIPSFGYFPQIVKRKLWLVNSMMEETGNTFAAQLLWCEYGHAMPPEGVGNEKNSSDTAE